MLSLLGWVYTQSSPRWPFVRELFWGETEGRFGWFLCCYHEQVVEQMVKLPVIGDVMVPMQYHSNVIRDYYSLNLNWWGKKLFLAATKQLYEWYFLSVCPSVCLSVCLSVTPFWLCSQHHIIMKFSGAITKDQGNVHAKGQGQRSKVKVTKVMTQLNRFRTVTPVWIHIWWWKDTYSLLLLRRGALLFFKVIRQISRSHGAKNRRIWPRLGVSGL